MIVYFFCPVEKMKGRDWWNRGSFILSLDHVHLCTVLGCLYVSQYAKSIIISNAWDAMLSWQIANELSMKSWTKCQDQWHSHLSIHSLRYPVAVGIIWTVLTCPWTQNKPLLLADVCCAFPRTLPLTSSALLSCPLTGQMLTMQLCLLMQVKGPCLSPSVFVSLCWIFWLSTLPQQIQLWLSLCIFIYMHIFPPPITLMNLVLLAWWFMPLKALEIKGARE